MSRAKRWKESTRIIYRMTFVLVRLRLINPHDKILFAFERDDLADRFLSTGEDDEEIYPTQK